MRAAIVTAVLYAVMMGLFSLAFFPLFLLMPTPPAEPGQPDPAAVLAQVRWFVLLYPAFGFVFGWLFGCGGALTYNLIRRFTGGLVFESEPHTR